MTLKFKGGGTERAFSSMFNNIAYAYKNAVKSNCLVTLVSGLQVNVAAGTIFFGASDVSVSSQNLTLDSNTSNFQRTDLIAVNNLGVASIIKGSPNVLYPPADYDPDNYVILAQIVLAGNATSIIPSNIRDIRIINIGAGASGTTFTGLTDTPASYVGQANKIIKVNSTATGLDFTSDAGLTEIVQDTTPQLGGNLDIQSFNIEGATASDLLKLSQINASATEINKLDNFTGSYLDLNYAKDLRATGVTTTEFDYLDGVSSNIQTQLNAKMVNLDDGNDVNITSVEDGQTLKYDNSSGKWINSDPENLKFNNIISSNLTVGTATSNVNLTSLTKCSVIEIENVGSSDCYFNLGSTAAITDMKLIAGASIIFEDSNFDYVSAICDTGDSTILNIVAYNGEFIGTKDEKEILTISATSTNISTAFTNTTSYKNIVIANTGTNDAYINFGLTATTSNKLLKSGEVWIVKNINLYQISAICDTAETTTVKILGVY